MHHHDRANKTEIKKQCNIDAICQQLVQSARVLRHIQDIKHQHRVKALLIREFDPQSTYELPENIELSVCNPAA